MKKIVIDGSRIEDRAALFEEVRAQLAPDELIGSNLDALHDALSQYAQIEVEVRFPGELRAHLGDYADRLLRVLWDVQTDIER